jgi:hypothetical protein
MAQTRNEEPTTENEAQDLKSFLEKGAQTGIEEVERFQGGVGVTVALEKPAAVPFRAELPELSRRIAEADENQVLLTISVDRVEAAGETVVHVFLNKDDANAKTSLSDSHYIGSFAFFCHTVDANNFTCEVASGEKTELQFRFNVTSSLRRPEETGPPRATLVVVPIDGRTPRVASVRVSSADLQLVKSVVRR